jgi:hypothetical protein
MFTFGPLGWVGVELNHHRAAQRRIKDQYLQTPDSRLNAQPVI